MKEQILDFNLYLINEANEDGVILFLSKKLITILQKIITEPIAKRLLDASNSSIMGDKKYDFTLLDVEKDSKTVSYMPKNRLRDIEINKIPASDDPIWESTQRQSMNWGKMINNLFPGEFTNMDIDRFYNRYRPEIDIADKENARFKVVHGEDIRYWYLGSRWDGRFGSCMQGSDKQSYFDYYCYNEEKCGLLVYFSERTDSLIIGRALVWNNLLKPSGDTAEDKNPYTLMDRVYMTENNSTQIQAAFQKYAIDHNWIYKSGSDQFLMNGIRKTTSVATRLKPVDHRNYPYVDTMCYYTPSTGRAASTPGNPARDPNNPSKIFPRYHLKNQNGSKTPLDR
jgi:hypothetical protein